MKRLVLFLLVFLNPCWALAHKPSDSYLTLYADGRSLRGQWDIALRDLEYAVGLDADGDGAITWGELKAKQADIDERPRLELRAEGRSRWHQLADYVREGVWHIWVGFDHILFLLSLLLPSVFIAMGKGWQPADRFSSAFWDVFKVATSFTVAHSITLSLAALSVIQLPSRLVESAIALSVVLAALNNVWPLVHGRRWVVAFGFGLIHGFGFASVLTDLGLPQGALLVALVGFNLGVEAGQLAIIAAFLPLAFALRRTWVYRRLVFLVGSAAIAVVAGIWLVERAFNLKLGLI